MTDWEKLAKTVLRAEMGRRDMTYADLASALSQLGIEQTEFNVRNKIGRGTFSAPFFLQCLKAMKADFIDLRSVALSPARLTDGTSNKCGGR